jgi:hypothetical protein
VGDEELLVGVLVDDEDEVPVFPVVPESAEFAVPPSEEVWVFVEAVDFDEEDAEPVERTAPAP